MFDKEKFTPEFYDKLTDSEKKEFVQIMLEDQLTDPLHIKGLPKPVQNCIKKAVRNSAKAMKEETIAEYPTEWIDGIRDSEIDIITGCTQNFKPQQKIDMLEAYENDVHQFLGIAQYHTIPISDRAVISPPDQDEMRKSMTIMPIHTYDWAMAPSHRADRMGRIWLDSIPKLCEYIGISKEDYLAWLYASTRKRGYQPNTLYIRPRAFGQIYKSSLWMKLSGMEAQSYSIDEFPAPPKPITTVQLYDVIHMHWNKQDLSDIKAHDFRYGKMWEDQELINYATGDVSPIAKITLESLAAFGPNIPKTFLKSPNLNNNDKKALERVIKKGRKRK